MVIVFDLDDTLYEEITYVRSGFRAVAAFLEKEFTLPAKRTYPALLKILEEEGRGRVFDRLLEREELYSRVNVTRCLAVYRRHRPEIALSPEADRCLKRLNHLPLYIVTDGHKGVQHNKLTALGLYGRVRFCYLTHRYGLDKAKPSPHCFMAICRREKVDPGRVVYIGDNPHKDFVGIKPLGFRTVRVKSGIYRDLVLDERHEAEIAIASLDALTAEEGSLSLFK